jgi:hypothetical protein
MHSAYDNANTAQGIEERGEASRHMTFTIAIAALVAALIAVLGLYLTIILNTASAPGSGGVNAVPSAQNASALFWSDMMKGGNATNILIVYVPGGADYYKYNDSMFYILGNDSKFVLSGPYLTYAAYQAGGNEVVCTQNYSAGITCSASRRPVVNSSDAALYAELGFNQSTLSGSEFAYKGIMTIAGRQCDNFVLTPGVKLLKAMFGSNYTVQSGVPVAYNMEVCLDKQYGYAASVNFWESGTSPLSGRSSNSTLFSLYASDVKFGGVNNSEVRVPIPAAIGNFTCGPKEAYLNFTSFANTANTTIVIRNLSSYNPTTGVLISRNAVANVSAPALEYGSSYRVSIPYNNNFAEQIVSICVDNYCTHDYCYVPT